MDNTKHWGSDLCMLFGYLPVVRDAIFLTLAVSPVDWLQIAVTLLRVTGVCSESLLRLVDDACPIFAVYLCMLISDCKMG